MNPNTGRSSMFAIVGGYLIYLAYELVRDLMNGVPTQMAPAVTILVAVLFTGIGVTLLVFAWRLWKKGREGREEDRVEIPEEETKTKPEQNEPKK